MCALRCAPVDEVRVVVPASWGPVGRQALREAADRAGLRDPMLVVSQAAVAGRVAAERGSRVGELLAVCDLGAVAEAAVLRRGPYEFEVLSVIDGPDAGVVGLRHSPRRPPHRSPPQAPSPQVGEWVGLDVAGRAAACRDRRTPPPF
jgi:hypothetical protein